MPSMRGPGTRSWSATTASSGFPRWIIWRLFDDGTAWSAVRSGLSTVACSTLDAERVAWRWSFRHAGATSSRSTRR